MTDAKSRSVVKASALLLVLVTTSQCSRSAFAEELPFLFRNSIVGDASTAMVDKLTQWHVVAGGGAMVKPSYEGSDEFDVIPVPMVSATFGESLRVDPRGVSLDLFKSSGLIFAGHVGYELGRDEDDHEHLRGLGDIDAGAVAGAKVSYVYRQVEVYAAVDQTLGGSEGLVGTLGADISYVIGRFLFAAGASATFADAHHMESYFGVNAAQSERSGLAQYDAGAGLKRFDATASVTYLIDEHWLARGHIGLGYLVDDAADSPVVLDNLQPSGVLTLGYRF